MEDGTPTPHCCAFLIRLFQGFVQDRAHLGGPVGEDWASVTWGKFNQLQKLLTNNSVTLSAPQERVSTCKQTRLSTKDVLSDWAHTCLLQSIRGAWADPQIRMANAVESWQVSQLAMRWWNDSSTLEAMTQVSCPCKRTVCTTALQNIAETRGLAPSHASTQETWAQR
jgi:hypothetical protein